MERTLPIWILVLLALGVTLSLSLPYYRTKSVSVYHPVDEITVASTEASRVLFPGFAA